MALVLGNEPPNPQGIKRERYTMDEDSSPPGSDGDAQSNAPKAQAGVRRFNLRGAHQRAMRDSPDLIASYDTLNKRRASGGSGPCESSWA